MPDYIFPLHSCAFMIFDVVAMGGEYQARIQELKKGFKNRYPHPPSFHPHAFYLPTAHTHIALVLTPPLTHSPRTRTFHTMQSHHTLHHSRTLSLCSFTLFTSLPSQLTFYCSFVISMSNLSDFLKLQTW